MADTVASTPWRGQTAEIVKVLNYTRGFYVGLVIWEMEKKVYPELSRAEGPSKVRT